MRPLSVCVCGAGPAGLGFALFWSQRSPESTITVLDRRSADDMIGFGVTMPRSILASVGYDGPAWDVRRSFLSWRGAAHLEAPLDMVTIERTTFVRWMQARCEAQGVDFEFGRAVGGVDELAAAGFDLIVGADGVHSAIRESLAAELQPSVRPVETRHTWLSASSQPDGLATEFLADEGQLFLLFAYPYADGRSTFIVECSEATWQQRGFEGKSAEHTFAELERLFARSLDGGRLSANGPPRWNVFENLSLERWATDRVVVIGDAAHTANYAGGFGTLLALEDARALAQALAEAADVPAGLAAYEAGQMPYIKRMQQQAASRHNWHARIIRDSEAGDERAVDRAIEEFEELRAHLEAMSAPHR